MLFGAISQAFSMNIAGLELTCTNNFAFTTLVPVASSLYYYLFIYLFTDLFFLFFFFCLCVALFSMGVWQLFLTAPLVAVYMTTNGRGAPKTTTGRSLS